MELKYKLTGTYGKASENVIFKTDEPLIIKLESVYVLGNMIIAITDGKKTLTIRSKGDTFEVPAELVKAGTLSFDISMYKGGQVIKTFACEPITIIEKDGKLFSYEAYELMRSAVEALRNENKELKERMTAFDERLKRAEKNVTELWENEEK